MCSLHVFVKARSLVRRSETTGDDREAAKLTLGAGLPCLRQTARADKSMCGLLCSVCAKTDYSTILS